MSVKHALRGSNPPSQPNGLSGGKYYRFYDYLNEMPVGHTLDVTYKNLDNLNKFREALKKMRERCKRFIRLKTKVIKNKQGYVLRIVKLELKNE